MPLYEYQCDACGHRFEIIQKFSDSPIEKCPMCGGHVHKLISSPAFQFKGTGWYVTDYAKKDSGSGAKSDSGTKTGTDGAKDSGNDSARDSGKDSGKESAKESAPAKTDSAPADKPAGGTKPGSGT